MKYLLFLPLFLLVFSRVKPPKFPIFGTTTAPALIDVGTLAQVMEGEAGNQGELGKIYVADVVKNRAIGERKTISEVCSAGFHKKRRIRPETWNLARKSIKEKPVHDYTYFFNPRTAKNMRFVRWGFSRCGKQIGNHFFFK